MRPDPKASYPIQVDEADDEEEAQAIRKWHADKLVKLGLAGQYTVGYERNAPAHHVHGKGRTGGGMWRIMLYRER